MNYDLRRCALKTTSMTAQQIEVHCPKPIHSRILDEGDHYKAWFRRIGQGWQIPQLKAEAIAISPRASVIIATHLVLIGEYVKVTIYSVEVNGESLKDGRACCGRDIVKLEFYAVVRRAVALQANRPIALRSESHC